MSQLNTLLESANPYKSLQSDAARLASKWAKTGLLEGLEADNDSNNMSMLLENQAKQLVTETHPTWRWYRCWFKFHSWYRSTMGGCCSSISKKGIRSNRSKRICFGSTNESSFRSSILFRFPVWY